MNLLTRAYAAALGAIFVGEMFTARMVALAAARVPFLRSTLLERGVPVDDLIEAFRK